jgi:tetratricopeptide (TPR) repeat protein
MPHAPLLFRLLAGMAIALAGLPASGAESLLPYRDRIEQGYNARDTQVIETTIAELEKAGSASNQQDLATYYTAFARLRQSAIPGTDKGRARGYLEQCIDGLEPLLERRSDYAQARALYASCLGASANYYVLKAATRGIAAGREMSAARKLAPDNPWVVFQDAVSDFLTPAMFGGNRARALDKLKRAEQLFVASRPTGSMEPVFGESETWLYMGRVYLAEGKRDQAREALEKARTLAPESADVRDELAKL